MFQTLYKNQSRAKERKRNKMKIRVWTDAGEKRLQKNRMTFRAVDGKASPPHKTEEDNTKNE